jgi:hypothetical protein
MAAAVWKACTKKLFFCRKKLDPGASQIAPGFCCLTGIFEGVLENWMCSGRFFGGEFVVFCMVDVVV